MSNTDKHSRQKKKKESHAKTFQECLKLTKHTDPYNGLSAFPGGPFLLLQNSWPWEIRIFLCSFNVLTFVPI